MRRWVLRTALAALALAASAAARGDEHAARSPAHEELLRQAEQRLAGGDNGGAIELLDRAAAMTHDPNTEMALVRAYMAQGQYRRALAFGAHAAGGHPDAPAATALYAWLLCVGDQCAYGQRLLAQALTLQPHDVTLQQAAARLQSQGALPTGDLLATPQRMAPASLYAGGQRIAEDATAVATGVVLSDGRHAVVPASAATTERPLWLRDGLGRTTSAHVERALPSLGLALVYTDAPLAGALTRAAPRDAFAGSPAFAVAFPNAPDPTPAWPWLVTGFVGRAALGMALPAGSAGAPVFDAAGRLVGMALGGERGPAQMVAIGPLIDALGSDALRRDEAATRLAADEIYERALHSAVRVLTLR